MHQHTVTDYLRDAHKLGQVLKVDPRNLNTKALARDIWHATPPENRQHTSLGDAARRIAGQIRTVLPAYRTEDPVGPGLPVFDVDRDGLRDHCPAVAGGDDLPAAMSWHMWRDYVHALAGWIADHLKAEPGTYRVEQAALDLHLVAPDLELSRATPRLLAGRIGMEGIETILTEYYGPGTGNRRWLPEVEGLDGEDDDWEDDDLDPWDDFYDEDDHDNDEVTELVEVINDLKAQLDAATAALAGHTRNEDDDKADEKVPNIWGTPWGKGFDVHVGFGGPRR